MEKFTNGLEQQKISKSDLTIH